MKPVLIAFPLMSSLCTWIRAQEADPREQGQFASELDAIGMEHDHNCLLPWHGSCTNATFRGKFKDGQLGKHSCGLLEGTQAT